MIEDKINVKDKVIRILGAQFFGIVFPNATGLIDNANHSVSYLFLTYGYFIFIAFCIWQGNRWILFRLQKRYSWFVHPIQKAVVLISANIFYTAPLMIITISGWYWFNDININWLVIQYNIIACVVCVIFITQVYETVFLIKQRESDMLQNEQLARAKAQAELEALKNQIDPHFMFNSLNSLSHLIDEHPKNAKAFTESLAEVYRYILGNKAQKLVLLEDELEFLNQYISMLKHRFGNSLVVNIEIPSSAKSNYLIPPLSIFFAVENAVKHNEIAIKKPLVVKLNLKENTLYIHNIKIQKINLQPSSGIGLKNLKERFKIIMDKEVFVLDNANTFTITLPLLPLST